MKKILFILLASALTMITGCMANDSGDTTLTETIHPSENMMARSAGTSGIIVKTYENTIAANFGNGYNSVKDTPSQGVCIEYDAPEDFDGGFINVEGQTKTYYKAMISESIAEISEKMDVSVGATVNYGMFSGSTSGDVMNSSEKSTHDIYVYAYVDVKGPSASITNVRLKEAYQKTHTSDNVQVGKDNATDVYEICGDYYAGTITSGARLHGIFQFSSTTDTEKQSIKTDLQASISGLTSGAGGSITENSASDFSSVVSNYNATVTSFITGCDAKIVGNDMDSFLAAVQSFPDEVNNCMADKSVADIMAMAASVTYYRMDSMIQDSFGITNTISDILQSKTNIDRLINSYASYETLKTDIEAILNNTSLYDWTDTTKSSQSDLNTILSNITAPFSGYLYTLQQSMDVCALETFNCDYPDSADLPDISAIRANFPGHTDFYPKDCLDYSETLGENVNGHQRTVYLNGDSEKPIDVYCENTNGVMSTYMDVPYNSITTAHASDDMSDPFYQQGSNFSGIINYWNWKPHNSPKWPDLITVYNRVRLYNTGANTIYLDHCDNKFSENAMYPVTTTTWPLGHSFGCSNNQLTYAPYGTGVGSKDGRHKRDSGISLTNAIDLRGTPFRLSPRTYWEVVGTHPTGGGTISGDRRTVTITANGNNGFFRPRVGGAIAIELEYVGD